MADIFNMLHLKSTPFFLSLKLRGQTRLINPILPNNVRRNDLHALVLFVKGEGAPRKGLCGSESRGFPTPGLISSQTGVMETCRRHLWGRKKEKKQVAREIRSLGHRSSPGQGINQGNHLLLRSRSPLLPKPPGDPKDSGETFKSPWMDWAGALALLAVVDVRAVALIVRAKQVLDLVRIG